MADEEKEAECADPDITVALERLRKRVEADKAAVAIRRKFHTRIEWGVVNEDSQPDSSVG